MALFSGIFSLLGRLKSCSLLFETPTSVSKLFCLFVLTSAMSWCLVITSWWLLTLRSRLVRGYSLSFLCKLEFVSICVDALGLWLLMYFAVHWRLPFFKPQDVLRSLKRRVSGVVRVRVTAASSGEDSEGNGGAMEDERVDAATELLGEEMNPRTRDLIRGSGAAHVPDSASGGLQHRLTGGRQAPTQATSNAKMTVGSDVLCSGDGDRPGNTSTTAAVGLQIPQGRCTMLLAVVLPVLVVVGVLEHVFIHRTIGEDHRQTQEIVMILTHVITDSLLMIACKLVIALRLERIAQQPSRTTGKARTPYVQMAIYLGGAVFALCTLYVLARFFWLVFTVDTREHLQLGVMGSFDICATEGLRMNPVLAKSWVWPALTHRRLFNFFTGSEVCTQASGLPSISLVDSEEHLLLVSPQCADGTRPHVYLHRPENNEFTGSPNVVLPETKRGNREYGRQLEALYGSSALAAAHGVVVRRDPKTKLILSVEVDPKSLVAVAREPRTPRERRARRQWPHGGPKVLKVPLGRSAAYTVFCAALQHEEYHLYPLDDAFLDVYSAQNMNGSGTQCAPWWKRENMTAPPPPVEPADEPAGNVFVMLFDAVSRQEIRRSLPKFSRVLKDFAQNSKKGHRVVEAEGAMTLGRSTAGNLVPMLAGTNTIVLDIPFAAGFEDVSLMRRTVMVQGKQKYGDMLDIAVTSAFCHDLFEHLMGYTVPSSGAGGRVRGADRYMYQPFCHMDYSGVHSNFKGPYSIVKRCMAGDAVWDHMANYTEALVEKQLEKSRRARHEAARLPTRDNDCPRTPETANNGKYFFHVMYMTEGHEGTHGVIPLMDDRITEFFVNLRDRLKFFDNPLNTFLLLADHGNHMGHYYEYTNAGEFERGTPPVVIIAHPDVLRRVDQHKKRAAGTALQNLLTRAKRMSTPLDVFLTLGDLLNVPVEVFHQYNSPGVVHPASLFDLRDEASSSLTIRRCSQFSTAAEHYHCPLDLCQPVKG